MVIAASSCWRATAGHAQQLIEDHFFAAADAAERCVDDDRVGCVAFEQ